ncbi:MAG: hypothetical protein WDA72_06035 [Desulfomonilia bacterium]
MNKEETGIFGKAKGRQVGPQGTDSVHASQQYPATHPGRSQVPFLRSPRAITGHMNAGIRAIWHASDYQGKDFSPFEVSSIPNKYKLAQVLACGLKAAVATYSQHWQGMYLDWTFNHHIEGAFSKFGTMANSERFVKNAFATVVLFNTGYAGVFVDMLKNRRRLLPPSMESLENLDMGTFEHNLRSSVGAVLGGDYGVNVIRCSLAKPLTAEANRSGYEALRGVAFVEGMDPKASIACILQIGLKQSEHRKNFDQEIMDLAAAKIIERKSERRNADFSRQVPVVVMSRYFLCVNRELRKAGLHGIVKTMVIEGNISRGASMLASIRGCIGDGLRKCYDDIIAAYSANLADSSTDLDFDTYRDMAKLACDLGQKVLKPREDGHKMLFVYLDMEALQKKGIPIDIAEQTAGSAIQAGLNSVHLDGTTNVPDEQDLLYGAFCMTGPIHSAELLDTDDELKRGWGQGFWNILAPGLPPTNKMLALISISAKSEQDAFIAEIQAMNERKSVNEIFWYKTWNHPQGKRLDVPQWISYAHVLDVLPIPGNTTALAQDPIPEHLPEDHPLTKEFRQMLK